MRKKRNKGAERIFEQIMAEYFPNLMKDMKINIQESQQLQVKNEVKESHTGIYYSQISKEGLLKAAREANQHVQ